MAHHPDYRYVNFATERLDALPVDEDVSLSLLLPLIVWTTPPRKNARSPTSLRLLTPTRWSQASTFPTRRQILSCVRSLVEHRRHKASRRPQSGRSPSRGLGEGQNICHGLSDPLPYRPCRHQRPSATKSLASGSLSTPAALSTGDSDAIPAGASLYSASSCVRRLAHHPAFTSPRPLASKIFAETTWWRR